MNSPQHTRDQDHENRDIHTGSTFRLFVDPGADQPWRPGLRQAGDVYMFGVFGLDVEQALGISLVHQLINYGYVALGGILFLRW